MAELGINVTLKTTHMEIEGVRVSYDVLPHLLAAVVKPDPRRWIRFERVDDQIHVHVKLSEEESNGTRTGSIGTPSPSAEVAG